jgi:hypothetical protein
MTPLEKRGDIFDSMTITWFLCEKCGHGNNLKPRKAKAARAPKGGAA